MTPNLRIAEKLVTLGGSDTAFVAAGAQAAAIIKAGPGRLCRLVCTVASTAAVIIYDNPAAASGNILYQSPAVVAIGTVIDIQVAALTGITLNQAAGGGGWAVSYS